MAEDCLGMQRIAAAVRDVLRVSVAKRGNMAWRIGVDIGGTFTDVALVDEETGRIGVAKVPTTPRDFGAAVLDGLKSVMAKYDVAAADVGLLAHATTIVTNAILEGKGSDAAIIMTRGFRDVLELRRSARADLYDLFQDGPHILIPRRHRLEITERIGPEGQVVTPLAEDEIDGLIARIREIGAKAVAVSLLFSFLNPEHEKRIGERLRAAFPDLPVYLSSEVLPEIREFERTSTTAVCAYVGPILASYLARLAETVRGLGLPQIYVMGSNGGVFEAAEGIAMPAMAVESGPAAGVVAAAIVANQTGRKNILSFDMGGTTAKASLIRDGAYETTPEYEVGGGASGNRWMNGTGHPIRVPVIDLAEVSAGGGSIAWVDPAGSLRVGPASAGADPGPVCYQRGGTEPTVTDCNLLLGYLDHGSLIGGELEISYEAAEAAIRDKLGGPLGVDPRTAAAAVIDVVNHEMAEALKIVSVQRGYDPRAFTLAAFGGAGPLHATALAAELGMREVLCPPIPGAFSALGLVGSDLKRDYVRTFYATTDAAQPADLAAAFAALEVEGNAMLERAGVPAERRRFERGVDARYQRQSYELYVPVAAPPFSEATMADIARDFHHRHRQTYGHENSSEPVQLVNVRLSAIGEIPALKIRQRTGDGHGGLKGRRKVWFRDGGEMEADVLDRDRLAAGYETSGPAIIESLESTILVQPGWRGRIDDDGFALLTRESGAASGENAS
jgi:N-methylhydantoinase A